MITTHNSKTRKLFLFISSILFLLIFSVLYYGLFYASNPREIPSALINREAPSFQLVTFNDENIQLSQFLGKPIILNFWASWCVACKEESQILESIHREYKDLGAIVLGIAISDTTKDAIRFVQKFGKTYQVGLDHDDAEISLNYGIVGLPETFYIDTKGIIREKILGIVDPLSIKEFLNKELINKK